MKTPILTLMAGLLLALLGACHSTPSVVTATGMPYEVVVVATPSNWNDTLGAVLKEELPAGTRPSADRTFDADYVCGAERF